MNRMIPDMEKRFAVAEKTLKELKELSNPVYLSREIWDEVQECDADGLDIGQDIIHLLEGLQTPSEFSILNATVYAITGETLDRIVARAKDLEEKDRRENGLEERE